MSWKWILFLALFLVAGYSFAGDMSVEQVPRISIQDLRSRLGSPDLVLLDVRQPDDWRVSGYKIPGAIRENPQEFFSWQSKFPKNKTLVLYCA